MRKNLWLTIGLVMIFPAAFSTASCAKKEMVQTDPIPTTQPEVSNASGRSAEEAELLQNGDYDWL